MNIKFIKIGIIALCVAAIVIGLLLKGSSTLFVPQVVMPYIIWFAGIIVFCIILPGKVGTVFD